MWLERILGGGDQLVTLLDAKDHLRISDDDSNDEITREIAAASAYLDVDEDGFGGLGFPLVAQVWVVHGAAFTSALLRLPFGRVSDVNEIRYIASDGSSGVVSSADYILVGGGRARSIVLLSGKSWPNLADRPDAIEIEFAAGYASVDDVPDDIKAAIRLLVGHFHENKLAVIEGVTSQEIQLGVERLVGRYRRFAA